MELNLFWKSLQCHLHYSSLMFLLLLWQTEGIKTDSAEAQRLCFDIVPSHNHSPCGQNKALDSYFSSHFKTHLMGKSSPFIAVIFFEPDCNFFLQSSFSHNRLILIATSGVVIEEVPLRHPQAIPHQGKSFFQEFFPSNFDMFCDQCWKFWVITGFCWIHPLPKIPASFTLNLPSATPRGRRRGVKYRT